jgi:protein-L-isoaspartate(D-aspartate) O-methyltransferase
MWTDAQSGARRQMVELQLRSRGIRDVRVLQAMSRVPRHDFVPTEFRRQAYEDKPLSIGDGQTISQPYIVAFMLEALALSPNDVVLEIGTGSGYVTALLAGLCRHVHSVELNESLARRAEGLLRRMGYINVDVSIGDGALGLPQFTPFNAITVAAAATEVPKPLFDQLAEGGRMVIPVGDDAAQQLQFIRKQSGNPVITVLEGVRFVPLLRPAGKPISR